MQNGSGGPATIVEHCAVSGERRRAVQWWRVGEVKPYGQYDRSVAVNFFEPGSSRKKHFTVAPDHNRYVTVIVEGQVVYDSRNDVPCDMAKWEETAARYRAGGYTLLSRQGPRP
jgi:hypothetical protein